MKGKETLNCELFFVLPEKAVVRSSSYSGKKQSFMSHQMSSKTEYKHHSAGHSTTVTKTHKSGGFFDGRNGNRGHKEEVSYKSSCKVKDKGMGCTTHYETQVKHKKVTTYNNSPSSKSGGGKGKKLCTRTTPGKSTGGVAVKTVTTYTSASKSTGGSGSRSHGGCCKKPSKSLGGSSSGSYGSGSTNINYFLF